MMTAGTSCGLTSQFGTPISGILFTLEITPSYYSVRNYWFAALSSVVAGMLIRICHNLFVATTNGAAHLPHGSALSLSLSLFVFF